MEHQRTKLRMHALFETDGSLTPVSFRWQDRRFDVDLVLTVGERTTGQTGGIATEYICSVGGRIQKIYYDAEENAWFVEDHGLFLD